MAELLDSRDSYDSMGMRKYSKGIKFYLVGPIAQSVEQRTFNPWVDGSSPSGPTCPNL